MGGPIDRARVGETPVMSADLARRCDAIEESYEVMLAFAARGVSGEGEGESAVPIREYLRRFDAALTGLGECAAGLVDDLNLEPAAPYAAFTDLLERDARAAQAAIRLVLAQPSLSSQLVDNLNASLHVRTVLTDLFLIDEVLKTHATSAKPASVD